MRAKTKSFLLKICSTAMVASLALCGAIAGSSVRSAVADGVEKQVGAEYAVDVKNAKATIATKTYGENDVTGLYVESDTAYSGSFRKVFTNDVRFEYRFPGERVQADELFTFTVTSVKTSDSFKIIYRELSNSGGRTQMYVSYTKDNTNYIRTIPVFGGHVSKPVDSISVGSVGQINGNIGDGLGKNTTNQMFSVELDGDVVNVYGKLGLTKASADKVLLCSFDGTVNDKILPDDSSLTEEENAAAEAAAKENRWKVNYNANNDTTENKDALVAAQNKFFMPKIDFSEGYTVDFSSSYADGVDVLFLNYTLGDDTSCSFVDLQMSVTVTESKVYNGETEVQVGDYIGISQNATDWDLYTKTTLSVAEGQWIDAGTYVSEANVPFDNNINTTALNVYETNLGGLLAGNVSVGIVETVDPLHVIGNVTGATVTGDYTQYKLSDPTQVNYEGVAIKSDAASWQGSFDGIFYGDVKLGFRFMGDAGAGKNGNADGEFTFKVIDATDSNNYFWVSYRSVVINNASYATVGVKEGGDRPTSTENMFTGRCNGFNDINVTPNGNSNPANGHFFPSFNSDRIETADAMNVLSFYNTKNEGMMKVSASLGSGTAAAKLAVINDIAKFDGTTSAVQGGGLSPLSKMYFPNGYRVEFSSNSATDVCFISINGTALNQGLAATTNGNTLEMKAEYSQNETSKVEIPVNSENHGFALTERVTVCGVLETVVDRTLVFSKEIDVNTVMAEETITVSYGNRISKDYQVSVVEPITDPQGKAIGSSVRLDQKGWRFGLALTAEEYAALATTYGETYDIGFAITKGGNTEYHSVKTANWEDITIGGVAYKYAVYTFAEISAEEYTTEISYYGYFELDGTKTAITETVTRTFDGAIRTTYTNGSTAVKEKIVAVYGNTYGGNE